MSHPSNTADLEFLTELLAISGLSGNEEQVAQYLRDKLVAAGCQDDWIMQDDAHERSPHGGNAGNMIVRIPGTGDPADSDPIMFSCHMDTVPICDGCEPELQQDKQRIVPKSKSTGLGADNRSGCGAIVEAVGRLLGGDRPFRPLTLLFSVQEEVGLVGSRLLNKVDLGEPVCCINVDGGAPNTVVHGAIGGAKWQVSIAGKAAHAGVHPDEGVSAAIILARALASLDEQGYHGKIDHHGRKGTANVGSLHGGQATNVVMDKLMVTGECRSHDQAFLEHLIQVYEQAFDQAAYSLTNVFGRNGKVTFELISRYPAFLEAVDCLPVALLREAYKELDLMPDLQVSDGGQDANSLSGIHGIPTVTIGAGAHKLHTTKEYLDLSEYVDAIKVLTAVAAAPRKRLS